MDRQHPPRGARVFTTCVLILAAISFDVCVADVAIRRPTPAPTPAASVAPTAPIRFVENAGQWDACVRFRADRGPVAAWFTDAGWTLVHAQDKHGVALRMTFEDAAASRPVATRQQPGISNYYLGRDPRRWASGVRAFEGLQYASIYPGVDVIVRKGDDAAATFEYDVLLDAGARVEDVIVRVDGHDRLRIEDGQLVLDTAIGPVRQATPSTWSIAEGGTRELLACEYVRIDDSRFGFRVPYWDGARALYIDPGIVWSTYYGASSNDGSMSCDVDRAGRLTVTGTTTSSTFPTTTGAFDRSYNGSQYVGDAFVTRFAADGRTLVFSTFLGGAQTDIPWACRVDNSGATIVAGQTSSTDFPTTAGALQPKAGGYGDGFITRLDASGGKLLWSTYLGGGQPASEDIRGVHVDRTGIVTVTGYARGGGLPTTTGVFQPKQPSNVSYFFNPFVARIAADGSKILWCTYCGGSNYGMAKAIDVDAAGNVTIAGHSGSSDYPTTPGAYQRTPGSTGLKYDAFVTRLDPLGRKLLWSTWIGGGDWDTIEAIGLNSDGGVTCTGWTKSPGFPTTANAFQRGFAGGTQFRGDAFVTRFDAKGASLVFSTFLGGQQGEEARDLYLDSDENVVVVGSSGSRDFPTTPGAYRTTSQGGFNWQADGFVSRLSRDGSQLQYSTYIGGGSSEFLIGARVLAEGDVLVTGSTQSTDYPTTPSAYQAKSNGMSEGFVTKLELRPTGVERIGTHSACRRPITIDHTALPKAGSGGEIRMSGAPLSGLGILGFGAAPALSAGFVVDGARVFLDPAKWLVFVTATADKEGRLRVPLSYKGLARGFRFSFQTLWVNNTSCSSTSKLSATSLLQITLQ